MTTDARSEMSQSDGRAGETVAERVARHPFLKGMSSEHLRILGECAMATHFAAGQAIFQAGESANGFYLLESGKVILEERHDDGEVVVVDTVSAGEPLGWSWIFAPYLWQFDARATEPCSALCLSGIMLRQHRDDDLFLSHELFKRMSQVMVRRLQAARSRLSLVRKSADAGK